MIGLATTQENTGHKLLTSKIRYTLQDFKRALRPIQLVASMQAALKPENEISDLLGFGRGNQNHNAWQIFTGKWFAKTYMSLEYLYYRYRK
jgi:hypothetical protein